MALAVARYLMGGGPA